MFKRIFTRAAALLLSLSFLSCGYVHAEDGQAGNIKGLQEAADYFLKNSYNVGIDYGNR